MLLSLRWWLVSVHMCLVTESTWQRGAGADSWAGGLIPTETRTDPVLLQMEGSFDDVERVAFLVAPAGSYQEQFQHLRTRTVHGTPVTPGSIDSERVRCGGDGRDGVQSTSGARSAVLSLATRVGVYIRTVSR